MSGPEIAKRARFDRIRYAQVWEDADILVEALRPQPGDTIVSIGSAGDNCLALLAEGPARVIAVDLERRLVRLRLRPGAVRKKQNGEDDEQSEGRGAEGRGSHVFSPLCVTIGVIGGSTRPCRGISRSTVDRATLSSSVRGAL